MKIDVRKNTLKGALTGFVNKIVVTLLPFIMRTIMIHYMGTEYLGLSSLFTSILNMLSLAELGFGSALVYSMYKPIANNDADSICALLGLYKRIYQIIGAVILVAGFALTPFINHLISGEIPADINIYVLYLIYLLNTVASYFLFAYKNSLLSAFQRNDLSNNVSTVLTIIEYSLQITLILIFRNYYFYVIIFPAFTIIGNIVRAKIVDKLYPQYLCKGVVKADEKKEIYKKTLALACHKIGDTISTSLDSMVVSAYLGLNAVAIFGNYNYVVGTLMALIWIVYFSMTAGIGNRMNLCSVDDNYRDFLGLTSFNNIIIIWATGCLLTLYQPFMLLWTGKGNLLKFTSVVVFSMYFAVYQSRKVVLLYKDASGLWREDQLKPILGAVVNLVINITLVQLIGINGVILSSIISFALVEQPWETWVLYKFYFHKDIKQYFLIELKAIVVALPVWFFLWFITDRIISGSVMTLLIRGVVSTLLPIPYLIFAYKNDKELKRILAKFLPAKFMNSAWR